jgi:hypothetical protein
MAAVSARDREILLAEVAPQMDELRPVIATAEAMGADWRPSFLAEAARWRAVANGRPEMSDARREAVGYSLAHQLLVEEAS